MVGVQRGERGTRRRNNLEKGDEFDEFRVPRMFRGKCPMSVWHVGWTSGSGRDRLCRKDAGQSWVELSHSPISLFGAAAGQPVSSHMLHAGEHPTPAASRHCGFSCLAAGARGEPSSSSE